MEIKDVFLGQRLPGAVLAFQDDRAALETFGIVPLPFGHGEAPDVAVGTDEERFCQRAVGVVVVPVGLAAQHYHCLGGVAVAVDRETRPRLHRIEDALARVFRRVSQVKVHPQPRGGFGLFGKGVQEGGGEEHGVVKRFGPSAAISRRCGRRGRSPGTARRRLPIRPGGEAWPGGPCRARSRSRRRCP